MTQHYYMCSTMWTVCELARGNYEILPLASVKSRFILPFWYQLTRVVLDKGPLNGCVCVCACVCVVQTSLTRRRHSVTVDCGSKVVPSTQQVSDVDVSLWRSCVVGTSR